MKLEMTQEPGDKKGKGYCFNECVEMKIDHDRDGVCISLEGYNQKPKDSKTRYYITVTLHLAEISKIVSKVTDALHEYGPRSVLLEEREERRSFAQSTQDDA
jgi:hypothetical protein